MNTVPTDRWIVVDHTPLFGPIDGRWSWTDPQPKWRIRRGPIGVQPYALTFSTFADACDFVGSHIDAWCERQHRRGRCPHQSDYLLAGGK